RQFIDLPDSESGKAFCVDRFHDPSGIEGAAKNFETTLTKGFAKIDQLHFEPAIGLIAAVAIERFTISNPVEWRFDLNIARRVENRRKHSFAQHEDIVRSDE